MAALRTRARLIAKYMLQLSVVNFRHALRPLRVSVHRSGLVANG